MEGRALALAVATGAQVRRSSLVPAKGVYVVGAGVMVCGPFAYAALLWEVEGRKRWVGRNWRRLKRERRKFITREIGK